MPDEGKLVSAGPLEKNNLNYRGIYIFDIPTIEEGKQLVATDPAVIAKLLDFDLYLLYGSAAFVQLPAIHKALAKYNY